MTALSPSEEYPFAFRRYFPHAILEEDLALCLLQAWEEEVCVSFLYQDMDEQEKKYTVVPLHLIQNGGRQHLLPMIFRKIACFLFLCGDFLS